MGTTTVFIIIYLAGKNNNPSQIHEFYYGDSLNKKLTGNSGQSSIIW
jgi:hypothetical protein